MSCTRPGVEATSGEAGLDAARGLARALDVALLGAGEAAEATAATRGATRDTLASDVRPVPPDTLLGVNLLGAGESGREPGGGRGEANRSTLASDARLPNDFRPVAPAGIVSGAAPLMTLVRPGSFHCGLPAVEGPWVLLRSTVRQALIQSSMRPMRKVCRHCARWFVSAREAGVVLCVPCAGTPASKQQRPDQGRQR